MFNFQNPGQLIDNDLELVLAAKDPGNPARNYVPTYRFKIMRTGQAIEVGAIDLRVGNPNHVVMYGGHIGYHILPLYRGHRYAARSVRLLVPLARSHDLGTLWITCNPDNFASRRSCELAGLEFFEIVDLPENTDMYMEGERQKCRYKLQL